MFVPVSISQAVMAKEYTSTFSSYACPWKISGAVHLGLRQHHRQVLTEQ